MKPTKSMTRVEQGSAVKFQVRPSWAFLMTASRPYFEEVTDQQRPIRVIECPKTQSGQTDKPSGFVDKLSRFIGKLKMFDCSECFRHGLIYGVSLPVIDPRAYQSAAPATDAPVTDVPVTPDAPASPDTVPASPDTVHGSSQPRS